MIRNVDSGASQKLSSAIASSTFGIESQSSSFPNPRVPSYPSPPPLLPLCIGIHSAPWRMGATKNQGGKAFNIQQFDCRKRSAQQSVYLFYMSVQFSRSVVSDFCDPTDCSRPGFPVYHQLPEFTKTHVHWVGDAIPPSHPLHLAARITCFHHCVYWGTQCTSPLSKHQVHPHSSRISLLRQGHPQRSSPYFLLHLLASTGHALCAFLPTHLTHLPLPPSEQLRGPLGARHHNKHRGLCIRGAQCWKCYSFIVMATELWLLWLNCIPSPFPHLHSEAQPPVLWLLGDRAFAQIIKLKWGS